MQLLLESQDSKAAHVVPVVETSWVGPVKNVPFHLELFDVAAGAYNLVLESKEGTFMDDIPIVVLEREAFNEWIRQNAEPAGTPPTDCEEPTLFLELAYAIRERMIEIESFIHLWQLGRFLSEGAFQIYLPITRKGDAEPMKCGQLDQALWVAQFLIDEIFFFATTMVGGASFSVMLEDGRLDLVGEIHSTWHFRENSIIDAHERLLLANVLNDIPDYRVSVEPIDQGLRMSVSMRHRIEEGVLATSGPAYR